MTQDIALSGSADRRESQNASNDGKQREQGDCAGGLSWSCARYCLIWLTGVATLPYARYCVETRRQDDRMIHRRSAGRYTQIREIE